MELKTIKMSDIIPDENNPRKDFGDLHALARTFEGNPYVARQPFNPIVVVEDGETYRIADGERRYRAMAIIGVEECQAVVCGGYEEADSMIAMLASDAKEPLKDEERSYAVQRALLLGVPVNVVENTGRLKRGQAKKIKSALKGNDGSVIQASLDQILEGCALREQGATEQEIEKVLNADDASWRHIASDVRQRIGLQEYLDEMEAVLEKYGFTLEDERPENLAYSASYKHAEDLEADLEAGVSESAYFFFNKYVPAVQLYSEEELESGVDTALQERIDIARVKIEEGIRDRAFWYAQKLEADRSGKRAYLTPHIDNLMIQRAEGSPIVERFRELSGSEGAKKIDSLSGISAEVFYDVFSSDLELLDARVLGEDASSTSDQAFWEKKIAWVDAFKADGYDFCVEEQEIIEHVCKIYGISHGDDVDIQAVSGSSEPEFKLMETPEIAVDKEALDVSEVLMEAEMAINDTSILMYESTPRDPHEASQPASGELNVSDLVFNG